MSRAGLIIVLLIAFIILPSVRLGQHLGIVQEAQAATTSITLYAAYSGWNFSKPSGANPTITVTQGDTVSFNLIGEDSLPHLFLLDFDGNDVTADCPGSGPDKCSGNIPAMGTGSVAPFTVTSNPGPYFYYCLYHSPYAMVGKFIVQSPPDFNITASPAVIGPLNTRALGTSTITVAPTNGFSSTVTLSASPSSGLNSSISPTSISSGSGQATLSVNSTTVGSHSVTITGTGSSGTHSVIVTVTIAMPDFKLALSSSTLTVAPGSSRSVVVTLTSLNGFSGAVSLTSALSSPGPQITFSPSSITLSSSGPVSSTLSASAASSGAYSTPVPLGNYNVNVTGTSGSLVHSATLALTIGSSSAAGALPTLAFVGVGIASAVAVVAAGVYFLRRRSKPKT